MPVWSNQKRKPLHNGKNSLFRSLTLLIFQHLKLSCRLKSNDEIRKWFRMFLGLAFVPVPYLHETFNVIKSMDLPEQYRLKCSKFNQYFLDTWLCGNYPGDIWTHFSSSTPRTNNGCEGYDYGYDYDYEMLLLRHKEIQYNNYVLIAMLKYSDS